MYNYIYLDDMRNWWVNIDAGGDSEAGLGTVDFRSLTADPIVLFVSTLDQYCCL